MYNSSEVFFSIVTDACLEEFKNNKNINAIDLSTKIMENSDFPLHAPVHHYLVPAVLLTAARMAQGYDLKVIERDLAVAFERAEQVPGGSCGFFGACGASVGCGIFCSLIMDVSPYSSISWAVANKATSAALESISRFGGPRCCKRCTWLSLLSCRELIEENLELNLSWKSIEDIVCEFHERNDECIGAQCPFFPLEERRSNE